jgi:hypothetical protein
MIFGRLTLEAFQHEPIEMMAGVSMGVMSLVLVAYLFYAKSGSPRWILRRLG